jgi:RNA polymerase sigma-19 factor, ECF subfamily
MKVGIDGRGKQKLQASILRYQKELHRYLLRRLKGAPEVDDLAQEVYLRMLRVKDADLVRSPEDYLYGIATHVVSQFRIRSTRDVVTYDSDAADAAADRPTAFESDSVPERMTLLEDLERAISTLPETHQAIFLMRKRDGFSLAEIALQLSLSIHTVKKYLFQAKAQIRTRLEPKE